jgi:uncharacterized protein YPO0396
MIDVSSIVSVAINQYREVERLEKRLEAKKKELRVLQDLLTPKQMREFVKELFGEEGLEAHGFKVVGDPNE